MKYNFQDQLLENLMGDDNNKGENVEKFMLLTTELLKRYKNIDKKRRKLLIGKKNY